ncbi:MAG: hypothetical protein HYW78_04900, partial [Parcubacteria group bacterium]|nr:hypothetical protein [Parcubacteria group bacterium]
MKKIIALFVMLFSFTLTNGIAQIVEIDYTTTKKTDTVAVDSSLKTEKDGFVERSLNATGSAIKNSFSATKNFFKTSKYSIELPYGKISVDGLNEYVGDEVRSKDIFYKVNSGTYRDVYGYTYKSISLNVPSKILYQGSFLLKRETWAFGVRGSRFNVKSDYVAGKVVTPYPGITDWVYGDGDSLYFNYLRSEIWNANMRPVWNDQEEGL